jgi:peptidoglycan/LPS O-acetylase OafA/YrhL
MARNRGLDSLRGLAILLVLGVHVQASPTWAKVGWLGVDLFFVLSGFLISNLLFGEYKTHGSINLKSFYIRRGFKLYPSFYFLVIASILYCWIAGIRIQPARALAEFGFMQNYFTGLWGHTWSLAVEEHFYILLPLTLVCLARLAPSDRPFRRIPVLFLVVAVLCLAARVATWRLMEFQYNTHFQRSHLRFDSLLFGVLLSYYFNFESARVSRWTGPYRKPLFFACFLAILPCLILPNSNPWVYTIGFSLAYMSFGGLLLLTLFDESGKLVVNKKSGIAERALAGIGVFSYSIYLWHVPIAMAFGPFNSWLEEQHVQANPYGLFILYLLVSIAFGSGLSKLLELPLLRFRDRVVPRRAKLGFAVDIETVSEPGTGGGELVKVVN